MKKDALILAAFQVWTLGMFALAIVAFTIAIWNLCTGNYISTGCREF